MWVLGMPVTLDTDEPHDWTDAQRSEASAYAKEYAQLQYNGLSDWVHTGYAFFGDEEPLERAVNFSGDATEFNVHTLNVTSPVT